MEEHNDFIPQQGETGVLQRPSLPTFYGHEYSGYILIGSILGCHNNVIGRKGINNYTGNVAPGMRVRQRQPLPS